MKANRKLKEDNNGILGIDYMIGAILVLVISAIAIAIIYPMYGSLPMQAVDNQIKANNHADGWIGNNAGGSTASGTTGGPSYNDTYMANATGSVIITAGTVMGLSPMMALVFIAAGIIVVLLSAFSGAGRQTL